MATKITFFSESRKKIMAGIGKLAETVRVTLGPKGKTVLFRRGTPIFSLDGVTVAKQIELEDPLESMGCDIIKDAAEKTDREAGDGTTTAILLSQIILEEGLKAIAAGIDTIKLKKGISEGLKIATDTIKKMSKPIKKREDIKSIGTISSRDPEIGGVIADIMEQIGEDAIIAVEESNVIGLHKEIVEGLQFEKGFISPYMMTNQVRGEAVLSDVHILVTTQMIKTNQEIYNILDKMTRTDSKTLLILAEDVSGEALATVIINKMNGRLNMAAVQAPGFGDEKRNRLEDVAILTGAKFASEEVGVRVDDIEIEDLGRADKVVIYRDQTVIIGGKGKKSQIKKRIASIRREAQKEESDFRKEMLKKREAKLTGGVAIIKVGTLSEQENREKRYRIEDAVRSTKSATEEGVVPGAGMCLIKCSKEIEKRMEREKDLAIRMGLNILAEAIKEPAAQIIRNTGEKPDVILSKVEMGNPDFGYNSEIGEYCDLIKSGIIDPAKVVRCAVENATSVSSMFLTNEAVITELKKEKNDKKS